MVPVLFELVRAVLSVVLVLVPVSEDDECSFWPTLDWSSLSLPSV